MYGFNFDEPVLMGIVNVTPDSFSDGGTFYQTDQAIAHALRLIEDGADILDIGGESSRPGSDPVSVEEECRRILPVIEGIRKQTNIPISVDTTKAVVAKSALDAGANWINDISALRNDPEMIHIIARYHCPVVIMHMKGTPKTMQQNPVYTNVITELVSFFEERITFLRNRGVEYIILDPGIGFGKRLSDNLEILKYLNEFNKPGFPVLIGTSRKSFIGMISGNEARQRSGGTIASNLLAAENGAAIFRVHDVKSLKEAFQIRRAIENPNLYVE